MLPHPPFIYLDEEALEGVLALFGVGERLYEPELAMLNELGVEATARYLTCVAVNRTCEDEEIVAYTLMGGV